MAELELSRNPFEAIRHEDHRGEYWTGRELMPLMTYARWDAFVALIEKAKAALALVQGNEAAESNFLHVRKNDGPGRPGNDYRLTRFAAYLTALAGDDTKRAIAEARVYFTVRAREAEVMIPHQREPMDELELAERFAQVAQRNVMLVKEKRAAIARALEAEQALGIAAPKADAWDALASAHGDYSVADAAKILCRDHRINIGRDRLFELLGSWGWLFRQRADGRWRCYQDHVNIGRLTELPTHRLDPLTGDKVKNVPQVRITAKGIKEIRERMIEQPSLFELEPAP